LVYALAGCAGDGSVSNTIHAGAGAAAPAPVAGEAAGTAASGNPASPAAGNGGRSGTSAGAGRPAAGSGGSGMGGAAGAGAGAGAGGTPAAGSGGATTAGASGAPLAGTGAGGAAGASTTTAMAWPKPSDLGADGPFMARTVQNSGPSNGYTLYFPQDLGRDGLKHPFITWGNGATTTPPLFALLPRLATHGFVIIASNNAFVTAAELKAGLDWLGTENARMDSMFYQKLDPNEVASMGYSLGSLGTFEIAADPRLKTTVHISGGAMNKSVVPNLKNPAAFICGDESDIAHANCVTDFEMAKVPVFFAVFPGEHLGILGSHTAQISKLTTAWLRWRLMHDTSLDSMFVGADCSVCKDSAWVVKQKMLDLAP
jgi:hypothetical protein